MKVHLVCTCGAQWKGNVSETRGKAILRTWEIIHTGLGHASCLPKVAAAARRKADLEYETRRNAEAHGEEGK